MAIDGIFTSLELLLHAKGRFLDFGKATHSNHCVVWDDIHSKTATPNYLEEII